jgi:CoA-transferase family III
MTDTTLKFIADFQTALGSPVPSSAVELLDGGSLPSVLAVSDLAQASISVAGSSLASFVALNSRDPAPSVVVDRDLASAWFAGSIRPQGWDLLPAWDAVGGDYECRDGWIRLHTNAIHHRAAALAVLAVPEDRAAIAAAVATWSTQDLENAVVAAGGAAAAMRSITEWQAHPQGRMVADEPLMWTQRTSIAVQRSAWLGNHERPLAGIRVLDLTRVLAGPVATRLLAGWGAEVLRIDPPDWDEPAIVPEVTLGKRCARLNLRTAEGRSLFLKLLGSADVLVHGYRPDALDRLGLGDEVRDSVRPGLIDVSLDAYGWTGPWQQRRGFDSLVQMSSGIADAGRFMTGGDRPAPLPVQALDHAAGYLLAAAAITGLTQRQVESTGSRWRTSLARMADLLIKATPLQMPVDPSSPPATRDPVGPIERTAWGDALRLPPPLVVHGSPLHWALPARRLGSYRPQWVDRGNE